MAVLKPGPLLLLALWILVLTSTALAQQHDNSSEEEIIQKTVGEFINAFNNLDWEHFRQYFADDATVFNPAIPEVTELHRLDGREKIETVFKSVFDEARKGKGPPYLHIRPENLKIQMLTNAAVVTFHFKRSGSSFGRRTFVWEKRNGKWLIVHLHASNVAE
jgi:ketosteroid isomerase-like protein